MAGFSARTGSASGKWRVYGVKKPANFEGKKYDGMPEHWKTGGWFWIRQGRNICVFIRVQGLDSARWLARQLNSVTDK